MGLNDSLTAFNTSQTLPHWQVGIRPAAHGVEVVATHGPTITAAPVLARTVGQWWPIRPPYTVRAKAKRLARKVTS
jgi:hypothetical protein